MLARFAVGLAFAGTGCHQSAGREASADTSGALCREADLGPSPFTDGVAPHIVLADLTDHAPGGAELADVVRNEVEAELARVRERELPQLDASNWAELERLHCVIGTREQAYRVAQRWGADIVLWGREHCSVAPELERAMRSAGHTPPDHPVCPKLTLYGPGLRPRANRHGALPVPVHFDLPALSPTAPNGLVQFILGLRFYERRGEIARRFLAQATQDALSPLDENLALLHFYTERPLEESRAALIEYSLAAQAAGAQKGGALEGVLLSNLGWALCKTRRLAEGFDDLRRGVAILEQALGTNHPITLLVRNDLRGALAREESIRDERSRASTPQSARP